MLDRRIIGGLAIACALAVGTITPASATPILGIELEEAGFATFSTTSTTDPLIVSQSYGTFSTNVEVNNVTTNPLSIDLSSINFSTNKAGTITITISAKDLYIPLGSSGLLSQFSGNFFFGTGTLVTLSTYLSNSDTLYGTDTLLASFSSSGSPFSFSLPSSITTTDPFALTEVLTITTVGKSILSMDGSIAAAPEIDAGSGGAAIALLLGVLGLVGERRWRSTAIG